MKKIVPFKKDITFKTNISEITSISLENTLNLKDNKVLGDFIVSGEYKVSDNSTTVEPFELKLPFEIDIDDRYDTKKAIVDIDDFYYEIESDNTLSISIDVLIDQLIESPIEEIIEQPKSTILESEEDTVTEDVKEERCIESEESNDKELVEDKIDSLFSNISKDSEAYVTYNVFIVREGDSLESIMEKYNITEEELKKYNDLTDLKLGDKLIIPNTYERD